MIRRAPVASATTHERAVALEFAIIAPVLIPLPHRLLRLRVLDVSALHCVGGIGRRRTQFRCWRTRPSIPPFSNPQSRPRSKNSLRAPPSFGMPRAIMTSRASGCRRRSSRTGMAMARTISAIAGRTPTVTEPTTPIAERAGIGGADDVVYYQLTVTFPPLINIGGFIPGLGGNHSSTLKTIVRRQPYAAQTDAADQVLIG